jgi:hypothetical protein
MHAASSPAIVRSPLIGVGSCRKRFESWRCSQNLKSALRIEMRHYRFSQLETSESRAATYSSFLTIVLGLRFSCPAHDATGEISGAP